MFYTLSKIAFLLIRPSNAMIALMAAGIVLRGTRLRRTAILSFGFGFLLLVVAAWTGVSTLLLRPLEERFPRGRLPETPPAGIILLGGVIDTVLSTRYGTPEMIDGAERLAATAELARRFPQAQVVITGGQGDGTGPDRPEADVAADLLVAWGVSPDRIVLERGSRNTRENAVLTYDVVQPKADQTWIVVTSAFHMPRAIGCFRAAGWTGLAAWPVDFRTIRGGPFLGRQNAAEGLELFDLAAKEWIGLAAYRFGGYTDALFPAP